MAAKIHTGRKRSSIESWPTTLSPFELGETPLVVAIVDVSLLTLLKDAWSVCQRARTVPHDQPRRSDTRLIKGLLFQLLLNYQAIYYGFLRLSRALEISVPVAYARQQLCVRVTVQDELVIHTLMGEEIARHPLAWGQHQQTISTEHYQPLWVVQQSHAPQPNRSSEPCLWDAPEVETRPLSIYDEVSQ